MVAITTGLKKSGTGRIVGRFSALMSEAIHLSFRYSQHDYVRALRAHYLSRLRIRFDIAAAVVGGLLGAYLWRSEEYHWVAVACVAGSVALVLMIFAAMVVIPPVVFRSQRKLRDAYSLTFSEDGIHFRTAHVDSQLDWSLYSAALIDAHSYVLYYGSRQFTVIPKRVFESVQQQQKFEQLVIRHIPQVSGASPR